MKWLKWLLGLCNHKWKTVDKNDVYTQHSSSMPTYIDYILECEKCGKIKKTRT